MVSRAHIKARDVAFSVRPFQDLSREPTDPSGDLPFEWHSARGMLKRVKSLSRTRQVRRALRAFAAIPFLEVPPVARSQAAKGTKTTRAGGQTRLDCACHEGSTVRAKKQETMSLPATGLLAAAH